jgi:hypothetical protein
LGGLRYAVVLFLIAGCDGFAEIPAPAAGTQRSANSEQQTHSGERLQSLSDGSWYDTVLGLDCRMTNAGDGQWYCLPTAVDASYFADASCTQPLAAVASDDSAPAYLKVSPPEDMCGPDAYFTAGPERMPSAVYGLIVGPSTLLGVPAHSSCVLLGAPSPGFVYYGLGSVMPLSLFAYGGPAFKQKWCDPQLILSPNPAL